MRLTELPQKSAQCAPSIARRCAGNADGCTRWCSITCDDKARSWKEYGHLAQASHVVGVMAMAVSGAHLV